jgi:hypothetical protein
MCSIYKCVKKKDIGLQKRIMCQTNKKKEAFIAGKDDYTRQSNMNLILNNQSRDIQIIVIAFKLNKLCCAKIFLSYYMES